MQIQQQIVTANGVQFHCLVAGSGAGVAAADAPLLLCLHGFPDSAQTWQALMPVFAAAGYRVVAPYMRGYHPTALAADEDYSPLTLGSL